MKAGTTGETGAKLLPGRLFARTRRPQCPFLNVIRFCRRCGSLAMFAAIRRALVATIKQNRWR
jgi:hypothetical protein